MTISTISEWKIDTSAGAPILMYKNCSVIESEQAEYVLSLIRNAEQPVLAVREAQSEPVAYRYRYNGKHLASAGCGDMVSSWKYCEEVGLTNPDERYECQALFATPTGTAVPADVAAALDWIDDFIARCNGDDRGACNSVNVLRAAMLQPVSQGYTLNSPVIPDGWKMVPAELTAENGAKASLIGEFTEVKFINCPECFGGSECESCDGSGRIKVEAPVSWTTVKAIWKKGIEHFDSLAAAPTPTK